MDDTFSLWQAWNGTCDGTPEQTPRYPSPDIPNGPVGADAAYIFAVPTGSSLRGSGAFPQGYQGLELSLDGGATWGHPAPLDPEIKPGHTYQYQIIGEGQPLRLRVFDSNPSDNYGQLRIQVRPMSIQSLVLPLL